jgi:predicted AlkP superfamily pyrophosphatase or phosphodiesterase
VITVLVDGFGWSFFERFADELPFLRRVVAEGRVSMLSAQFPTTTAAHVTTLHTGLPVGESGVFEWQYYEPTLGAMFMPLPAVALAPGALEPVAPPRGAAYPAFSLYGELAEAGVRSYCYQSARYATSVYSRAVTAGARVVPFRTLPEAAALLVENVRAERDSTYHAVYFDVVDATSHRHGPSSRAVAAEIRSLFRLLEDELAPGLAGTDTLIMITADHGHVAVDPARAVHLDELLPELPRWLETLPNGRPKAPAGSARDQFLYVRPERVDEACDALGSALAGLATVHRTADLVEGGYFGHVQQRLRDRLAPLVVLPRPGEMVWWSGGGRFVQEMRGHHGGLSPDELEIPLLAWRP